MESYIIIRASTEEMRNFLASDAGVRYCEAIPGGRFKVRYRHAEGHKLSGVYTIEEIVEMREKWESTTAANHFPSHDEVEDLKNQYPIGTVIVLDRMDDPTPVESGTRGTVDFIDDAGQIHMKWENGRSLALVPGVDAFHKEN